MLDAHWISHKHAEPQCSFRAAIEEPYSMWIRNVHHAKCFCQHRCRSMRIQNSLLYQTLAPKVRSFAPTVDTLDIVHMATWMVMHWHAVAISESYGVTHVSAHCMFCTMKTNAVHEQYIVTLTKGEMWMCKKNGNSIIYTKITWLMNLITTVVHKYVCPA